MNAVLAGIAAPLLTALAVLVVGRRVPRAVGPIGVAGTTLAFLASWAIAGADLIGDLTPHARAYVQVVTGGLPFDLAFRVDGLTALTSLLVTSVALAVQLYSIAYLRGDRHYRRYVGLVALFTSAMLLVVAADDLLVLLVGWEVMGICSYFLIAHDDRLRAARDAGVKAFVVTRLGDIGFLFGIFALALSARTFRISEIATSVIYGGLDRSTLTVATLLLLCGVVGKSAQFPLHVWLPDAMAGPTPISALIHAATMVAAGAFFVARMLPVFRLTPITLAVLGILAAITMLGGALAALAEDDLKRVLAWSTVSQLAYMFAALSVGNQAAGVLHLLSHGAFKALLFLCAGVIIHRLGTNAMSAMGGLRRAYPVTFVTMTIGLLALAGIPPVGGFFSKDAVLSAAEDAAVHGGPGPSWVAWLVLVVGLLTVAVTAAYAVRLWLRVFFGSSPAPTAPEPGSLSLQGSGAEGSGLMTWPLVVLAVPTVLVGWAAVAPNSLLRWVSGGPASDASAALAARGGRSVELVQPVTATVGLVLAVGAIGLVVARWRTAPSADPVPLPARVAALLRSGFGVDRFYTGFVVRPLRGLASLVTAGDRNVADFYVQGAGRAARTLGGVLRLVQTGNVQAYLGLLVAGVVIIVVWVGVIVAW